MKIRQLVEGQWALVTGASSGIGRDIASLHAFYGGHVVIVARREDRLMKLKKELTGKHGVTVEVLVKDLAKENAAQEIYDELKKKKIHIDILVNNAGLGGSGSFHKQSMERMMTIVNVNMRALTTLTRLFVPDMVKRKRGYVLNVASVVGFFPAPFMAVYGATKAYVVSFSQGLASEVANDNVTVTALCPGLTSTEFMDVAGMQDSFMVNYLPQASSTQVAELGYRAMLRKRLVVRDTLMDVLLSRFLWHLTPRRMFLKIGQRLIQ